MSGLISELTQFQFMYGNSTIDNESQLAFMLDRFKYFDSSFVQINHKKEKGRSYAIQLTISSPLRIELVNFENQFLDLNFTLTQGGGSTLSVIDSKLKNISFSGVGKVGLQLVNIANTSIEVLSFSNLGLATDKTVNIKDEDQFNLDTKSRKSVLATLDLGNISKLNLNNVRFSDVELINLMPKPQSSTLLEFQNCNFSGGLHALGTIENCHFRIKNCIFEKSLIFENLKFEFGGILIDGCEFSDYSIVFRNVTCPLDKEWMSGGDVDLQKLKNIKSIIFDNAIFTPRIELKMADFDITDIWMRCNYIGSSMLFNKILIDRVRAQKIEFESLNSNWIDIQYSKVGTLTFKEVYVGHTFSLTDCLELIDMSFNKVKSKFIFHISDCAFGGEVNFKDVSFNKFVSQNIVHHKTVMMDKAIFLKSPEFTNTEFRGHFDFFDSELNVLPYSEDKNAVFKFRKMRNIFSDQKDEFNEALLGAFELEAKARDLRNKSIHSWDDKIRIWFYDWYGFINNYGRNTWRPWAFMFIILIGFSFVFILTGGVEFSDTNKNNAWSNCLINFENGKCFDFRAFHYSFVRALFPLRLVFGGDLTKATSLAVELIGLIESVFGAILLYIMIADVKKHTKTK